MKTIILLFIFLFPIHVFCQDAPNQSHVKEEVKMLVEKFSYSVCAGLYEDAILLCTEKIQKHAHGNYANLSDFFQATVPVSFFPQKTPDILGGEIEASINGKEFFYEEYFCSIELTPVYSSSLSLSWKFLVVREKTSWRIAFNLMPIDKVLIDVRNSLKMGKSREININSIRKRIKYQGKKGFSETNQSPLLEPTPNQNNDSPK